MAQKRRPSYLDYGKDGGDALNRSWDVESRYRLQENALGLPNSEDSNTGGGGLFRAQVELGLHELTAAMSSLSRRIDKLESNAAAPEREKQDEAVKELARNARCLSQALTGIASARTRRRALHGFFHESDERRAGCGDRIDPAARALIVEGLSCLAGKVRVETGRGGNANSNGLGLSRSNASHASSPSRRRRPKSPPRFSLQGNGAAAGDSQQGAGNPMANFDARVGGREPREAGPAPLSARELSQPPAFAQESDFSPGKLEVGHLGGLGSSLPPSHPAVNGFLDGRTFSPATAVEDAEGVGVGTGEVDRWRSECAELAQSTGRQGREQPLRGGYAGGGRNSGGGAEHRSSRKVPRGPSTRVAPDAAAAALGDSGAKKNPRDKPPAETPSRSQPRTGSAQPRRRRSTLDMLHGGKNDEGSERRLPSNGDMRPSLDAGGPVLLTDAQGFLDLGAASADGESGARLAKAKRSDGLDPRVAELEVKLQELRRIGDKIREQAANSTAEPSLTIPTQDLANLSPWFQRARLGSSTPGSLRPPSSSRCQRQDTAIRVGRARGGVLFAAAPSAFTSAEPSPSRPAEYPTSTATAVAPPVPPRDHPGGGAQPALFELLAPPFNNAVLGDDFVASLERHLSEYREHAKGEVKERSPGEDRGCVRGAAVVQMDGVVGASVAEASDQEKEEEEEDSQDTTPGEAGMTTTGAAKKTSSWAQEYHDYLCSKEA